MLEPHHPPSHSDTPHEGPIKTPKQVMVVIVVRLRGTDRRDRPARELRGRRQAARGGQRRLERRSGRPAHPAGGRGQSEGRLRSGGDAKRRAGLHRAVRRPAMPRASPARRSSAMTAAWAPRIKSGFDTLLASALKGKGAMGAARRRRLHRSRNRTRGRLHGQQGRRASSRSRRPCRRAEAGRGVRAGGAGCRAGRCCGHRSGRRDADRRRTAAPATAAAATPPRPAPRRRCTRRSARPAMSQAWPVRRSSATRPRGRRASHKASTP